MGDETFHLNGQLRLARQTFLRHRVLEPERVGVQRQPLARPVRVPGELLSVPRVA
jgi:hypothetical protein